MELKELLAQSNITKALVVDDAFDVIPLAADLMETPHWETFFDDLSLADNATIETVYPPFKEQSARADLLRNDDDFVRALWENRALFKPELLDPLFKDYELDKSTDLKIVEPLMAHLVALGMTCEKAGRDFERRALDADLIFVDLFLSTAQRRDDVNISINGIKKVVAARKATPPLVILISRSNRLEAKREEFQDKALLFESNFRILEKRHLADIPTLEQTLVRMAKHYPDSTKLTQFVDAWETGLEAAGARTTGLIRKLSLSDIAQINELLLSAEGEPAGSYLVDVFDKVLQHEIERATEIIDAAIALNYLDSSTYPPPYVPGAKDLQDLVHRSMFQNRARLRLSGTLNSNLAFGDVLRRRVVALAPPNPDPKARESSNGPIAAAVPSDSERPITAMLSDTSNDHVLAVLTPACDLQRGGAKRILLLVGKLNPLGRIDWHYRDEGVRTPVVELADKSRFWIKWDLKHIYTLSHDELASLMKPEAGDFERIARLRESHAIEIQQKLLSNLGRIGLAAAMPATFPMLVEAYLPDTGLRLVKLEINTLTDEGVCFVGRGDDPKKPLERLVLTESACDAIIECIATYDLNNVHPESRKLIEKLRLTSDLRNWLDKGIWLAGVQATSFKEFSTSSGDPLALVKRARIDAAAPQLTPKQATRAGIVLSIFDPTEVPPKPGEGLVETS